MKNEKIKKIKTPHTHIYPRTPYTHLVASPALGIVLFIKSLLAYIVRRAGAQKHPYDEGQAKEMDDELDAELQRLLYSTCQKLVSCINRPPWGY